MKEKELIQGIQTGQVFYYEKLIDCYASYISRVVIKVAGSRLTKEDMEEICADVFIKMWENKDKLNIGEGALKSYLGAMARNKTINKLRAIGGKVILPLEEDEIKYRGIAEEGIPENEMLAKEEHALIMDVIRSLPEPDGEIFIRRYFYLEKLSEIAKALGMEVATVGTKLHRGKQKLQKVFKERGGLGE
ncbi:RNA polymerase sigma factor [Niameybacter massiliensis]|uniref:RNA polymerase sigma factor n=1 Tax=Niameybacter massiliensis TaxID=1658108 RepID=UPI0006B6166F|nr:sigma-70 family RNA polymerase sigma factor [Niameybacter massiliensis]